MPSFSPSTPTVSRKFAGVEVGVPEYFTADHALSANEARWANTQLGTVIGNAFGSRVRNKKLVDDKGKALNPADSASVFLDMFHDYDFTSTRGNGKKATSDPVAALINFLSKEAIKAKILRKGLKVRDFMSAKVMVDGEETSKFLALAAEYAEVHYDDLFAQAEAQLEVVSADDDDISLD